MATNEGNTPAIDVNQREYIQYSLDVEQALSSLESGLHNSDDPEEIIMNMLVAATHFYDGDWAGIMEADLTMKIWSTLFWYNRTTGGMTPNRFGDIEEGDYLWRWIEALTQGKPMLITDIEDIRNESPLEYRFLKYNGVQSMIAVPFWKRPTGFLIVRNPKRYITRSSLLQMMAFVAVSSVNEKRLMDSTKLNLTPDIIKKDTDVVINLFDGLQIITSKGVLTEADLKSPKMGRLIVYLLTHDRFASAPLDIFNALWSDEDDSRANTNVKVLVYRLQQIFGLISDHRLVESVRNGYRINPELNIITDLNIFSEYWNQAQVTADPFTKGNLLKKAMDMYKHGPMPTYADEHWFIPTVAHYSLRYMGVVNQLLATLDLAKDYVCIHEYANHALQVVPSNADAHYWLIYAMQHLGTPEIAMKQLQAAKRLLTTEYYNDLLKRLGMADAAPAK